MLTELLIVAYGFKLIYQYHGVRPGTVTDTPSVSFKPLRWDRRYESHHDAGVVSNNFRI